MALFNFLKNVEITDSLNSQIEDRLSTPIYGTFIILWSTFHWSFLYTAIFISEDNIFSNTGQLKTDYLISRYWNLNDPWFYLFFVAPFIFTWLLIWVLPKYIFIPAFEKDQKDRFEKRRFSLNLQQEVNQQEVVNLKTLTEKAEEEKHLELVNPEIVWEEDFLKFKSSKYYEQFHYLIESLYEHRGSIQSGYHSEGGGYYDFELPTDLLSYLDSNELVAMDASAATKVSLTSKGRFFIKRYNDTLS